MDSKKRLLYGEKDIKFHIGNVEINIITINYEPPVPLRYFSVHSHGSYEFHYIPYGEGTLKVNHTEYRITPGTFYLTGPGMFHEQIADEDIPMCEYCLNFEFKMATNMKASSYYNKKEIEGLTAILSETSFWFGKDEFSTFELFERIFYEIEHRYLGYCSSIQNLASQIIINSIRSFAAVKEAQYDIQGKLLYDKRRAIIDGYFRKYENDLRPQNLAQILGISDRQLNRIMKQYYGQSFKKKLLHTRIQISKELLDHSDLTVSEIAVKVGFSTSSHFHKIFSHIEGMPPSEYRQKQIKEQL